MNSYQKQLWDALNSARKDTLTSVLDGVNLYLSVQKNDYLHLLRKLWKVRNSLSLNIQNQLEYYWNKEGIDKCSPGWCYLSFEYDIYDININFTIKNKIIRCPKCNKIAMDLR